MQKINKNNMIHLMEFTSIQFFGDFIAELKRQINDTVLGMTDMSMYATADTKLRDFCMTYGIPEPDKLIEEGYMKEVFEEGMWRKVVTEKGKDAGIFTEIRISKAETEYSVIMYNQQAQELLVQKLKKWLQS